MDVHWRYPDDREHPVEASLRCPVQDPAEWPRQHGVVLVDCSVGRLHRAERDPRHFSANRWRGPSRTRRDFTQLVGSNCEHHDDVPGRRHFTFSRGDLHCEMGVCRAIPVVYSTLWKQPFDAPYILLQNSLSNTGSYSWTVPPNAQAGPNVLVVASAPAGGVKGTATITISAPEGPYCSLTFPSAAANWGSCAPHVNSNTSCQVDCLLGYFPQLGRCFSGAWAPAPACAKPPPERACIGCACNRDWDCNGFQPERELVCSNAKVCISGKCHVDFDCPRGKGCERESGPNQWTCVPTYAETRDCGWGNYGGYQFDQFGDVLCPTGTACKDLGTSTWKSCRTFDVNIGANICHQCSEVSSCTLTTLPPGAQSLGTCQGTIPHRGECEVVCSGYPANGVCDSGAWNPPPSCQAKPVCELPQQLPEGATGAGGCMAPVLEGENCSYACASGYDQGAGVCSTGGDWVPPPRCIGRACTLTSLPPYAIDLHNCGVVRSGEECTLTCDSDHIPLSGECVAGTWEVSPACLTTATSCGLQLETGADDWGSCPRNIVPSGTVCSIKCAVNYAPSVGECKNGVWDSKPMCTVKTCPLMKQESARDWGTCLPAVTSGYICAFDCKPGYSPVVGSWDGAWKTMPSCVANPCALSPPDSAIDYGTCSASVPSYTYCKLTCKAGYHATQGYCQAGTWVTAPDCLEACSDGICSASENCALCPADCPCPTPDTTCSTKRDGYSYEGFCTYESLCPYTHISSPDATGCGMFKEADITCCVALPCSYNTWPGVCARQEWCATPDTSGYSPQCQTQYCCVADFTCDPGCEVCSFGVCFVCKMGRSLESGCRDCAVGYFHNQNGNCISIQAVEHTVELFMNGVAKFMLKQSADEIVQAFLGKSKTCPAKILDLQYEIVRLSWHDPALYDSIPRVGKVAFKAALYCFPKLFLANPYFKLLYKVVIIVANRNQVQEYVRNVFKMIDSCKKELWTDCGEGVAEVVFQTIELALSKRDTRLRSVPVAWTCDPSFYQAGDGCDCGCGIEDPDCLYSSYLYGCDGPLPTCVAGECLFTEPPASWTCGRSFYGSNDGCDCECGAADPDCLLDENAVPFGCSPAEGYPVCTNGKCTYNHTIPPEWICDLAAYGSSDGCDCYCGAADPDCTDPHAPVYNCPCAGMECHNGLCSGACSASAISYQKSQTTSGTLIPRSEQFRSEAWKNGRRPAVISPPRWASQASPVARQTFVPLTWTCDPQLYAAGDFCECDCGVYDPDCDVRPLPVLGCEDGAQPSCSPYGQCVYGGAIPVGWTCDPLAFNSSDGCDCGCGAVDPDCAASAGFIFGCVNSDNLVGCSAGTCEYLVSLPKSWTCPPDLFNANDGCHCNCGANDPDCDKPGVSSTPLGCPCTGMMCSSGICSGDCFGVKFVLSAPVCGDGNCDPSEEFTCADDCSFCGDGSVTPWRAALRAPPTAASVVLGARTT
eukprot:TRINITY_DN1392_c0_g1_i2.p1 TRINITY_DN1392_c0_g1~~TRINITY_DN1392_c0_g1_i2.p1  ORF type:complete len:1456 (-),score=74.94 TRINITY_DN1392_c0_g1_i2:371-4738(-)